MAPTTKMPIKKTCTISISGGSGSGKTTLTHRLAETFDPDEVLILNQDSYYYDQSGRFDRDGGAVNFDHPSSIDFNLLATHLVQLANNTAVDVPIYDFATHTRTSKIVHLKPKPFILVDGTLLLSQRKLLKLFNHRIFLDVPESIRFERRLTRDVRERGREIEGIKRQFELQVAPMHDIYVQPSMANADFVIPHGSDIDAWIKKFISSLN